jgi:exonuclease SbcD
MIKGVFDADSDNTYSYNEALHKLFEHEIKTGHIDPDKRNVLISHQFYLPMGQDASKVERSESEISAVGNVDVVSNDVLAPFDYVALGHIHKPMTVGEDHFRYSGTPLSYSISEANQEKGALLVDIGEKGNTKIEKLPLKPLHKITTIENTFENVLKYPTEDYVQVILTDTDDLDVVDLKERLNIAFPNLLEIQRKYTRGLNTEASENIEIKNISPYDLICEFIPDMDDEEIKIMKSVINEAMEVDE